MNPKVLLTAFSLVLLAELGDKTQLTTMLLAAQSRSPWAVFLGASLALVLTSLLGVVVGAAVTRVVPAAYIRWGAGVGFVAIGLLLMVRG